MSGERSSGRWEPVDRSSYELRKSKRRSPVQVYVEDIGHFPSSHPQELLDAAHDYYLDIGQHPDTARKSAARFVTNYSKHSGYQTSKYINKFLGNTVNFD